MVGTIGALRALPAAPVNQAVEYALALISGWTKKDREPFEKKLEELREAAAHNQTVYDQASEAVNDASRRDKLARELTVEAAAYDTVTTNRRREAEAEMMKARAKLEAGRAAHESRMVNANHSVREREQDVFLRETEVTRREQKAAAAEQAASKRYSEAEEMAAAAEVIRDRYEANAAAIAAIINRQH